MTRSSDQNSQPNPGDDVNNSQGGNQEKLYDRLVEVIQSQNVDLRAITPFPDETDPDA